MPGLVGRAGFAVGLLIAVPALAALQDIRKDALPQEPAVLTAYADMVAVEGMVYSWRDKWPFDMPKAGVVSTAKASLRELQKALGSSPDNVELLLLTGLVAHYAYNVDVEEAYDLAVSSLEKAAKLAPGDYRPGWFLGIHKCQSNEIKDGMGRLLATESLISAVQSPVGFWDDYIMCASVASMPAHLLRAGEHARQLNAPPSKDRDFLMETARKRFKTPDTAATYSREEVWRVENLGSRVAFTSSMCGLEISVPGAWKIGAADAQKGVCRMVVETSADHGKTGDVFPNILVIVRQPKQGETLEAFLKSFLDGAATKGVAPLCPGQDCLALETVKEGAYGAEGDGHFMTVAFRRDAPEFPGLLFEKPAGPPATNKEGAQYFRPIERLHRLEGPSTTWSRLTRRPRFARRRSSTSLPFWPGCGSSRSARLPAMQREADAVGDGVGRFDSQLDPAAEIGELRRDGAQAPVVQNGHGTVGREVDRGGVRLMAPVAPREGVNHLCGFRRDHAPVEGEVHGAGAGVLMIPVELAVDGEG